MVRDVYVAIMKAGRSGKGLRLTAEETRALSFDDAIETRADVVKHGPTNRRAFPRPTTGDKT